jgi:tellurite resistance protein
MFRAMVRTRPAITKTPMDTILLLHGMMVMSDFRTEAEAAMLDTFLKTLPEFRLEDIDELKAAVRKIRNEYPTAKDSIAALSKISSGVVKRKTFILALDIAMASGAIDAFEDELLEELRTVLGIDLTAAENILDVLAVKYAT